MCHQRKKQKNNLRMFGMWQEGKESWGAAVGRLLSSSLLTIVCIFHSMLRSEIYSICFCLPSHIENVIV